MIDTPESSEDHSLAQGPEGDIGLQCDVRGVMGDKPTSATAETPDDDDVPLTPATPTVYADDQNPNAISFDEFTVDLRTVDRAQAAELLDEVEREAGAALLDKRVQTVGTWENTVYRVIAQPNLEERRIQAAVAALEPQDRTAMASRFRNEQNKVILRGGTPLTDPIPSGQIREVKGETAKQAWAFQETGGAYRVLLYNSGLSLDLTIPTGNDFQVLLVNSWTNDRELGTENGAHYFAYNDQVYKVNVITFLDNLIVGSSFDNWQKKDQLWSLIKLPDLNPLLTMVAAMCYPDGYDGFVTTCTRPVDEAHPTLCRHTETIKANLFELATTRHTVMSKDAIAHMVEARSGTKHNLTDIAKYQSTFGFEGQTLTFRDTTFTMRIPSIQEHLEAGRSYIAAILNEIPGDNTQGRYEQMGFRYIRSFIPWIARADRLNTGGGTLFTREPETIQYALELLSDQDANDELLDLLRGYIDRVQLTYVGHPITPCPACNYVEDTPSGMRTFDPFAAFFTLALSFMKRIVS
jgi:hypothetical protein